MRITDVAWVRDHRGLPVLELRLDGHPAHIRSSQNPELTRRGIVDGIVFLSSERAGSGPGAHVRTTEQGPGVSA